MIGMTQRALLSFACASLLAAPAIAQEQQRIGSYKFWSAFSTESANGKVCWAATSPVDAEFSGGRRGDIFLMVANYPATGVTGEVSVISGYPYDENRAVQARIGSRTFSFFSADDGAWLETRREEARMVAAMKAGVDASITGYAAQGGRSTDKFSLLGFTAANKAAIDACS